jgi:hypothetical protein
LRGADGQTGDRHALDQHEGIVFHHHAIGEGAGIAFVGIADDVLLGGLRTGTVFHLMPVGNAAPPRPRRPESSTSCTMASLLMPTHALESGIAFMRQVVVQRQRISDTDARKGQALLFFR